MARADLGAILGSPVWTVLATVFAAAAILVSIWLYRRQRTRKSLSYETKVTEVVSVHSAAKDRIEILFDGEQIQHAYLAQVRIENNGNLPVPASDYEMPIVIDLGQGAGPLTAEVGRVEPLDLPAELLIRDQTVVLQPLLLNPGDGLTINMFARGPGRDVDLHYRIVGVSEMTDARAQREAQKQMLNRLDPVLSALVGVGVSVAILATALTGIGHVFPGLAGGKNGTAVKTKSGREYCGTLNGRSANDLLVAEQGTGSMIRVPLAELDTIKPDSC